MTNKRVKVVAYILGILVLAFALYTAGGMGASRVVAAQEMDENIIAVNGTGIIKVKPDTAYITVGVETRDTVAKEAQRENAQIMDKIVKKLESLGIKEDDIKTVSYNLYPMERYDDKTRESHIYEYRANNMVEITIRDIESTGTIIDGVSSVGSNKISSIRFGVEDTERYYSEALSLAVKNASDKAGAIASGLGVTVKNAVNVQEISAGGPTIMKENLNLKRVAGAADMAATPISAGEMEISAMVLVQYKY